MTCINLLHVLKLFDNKNFETDIYSSLVRHGAKKLDEKRGLCYTNHPREKSLNVCLENQHLKP